MGDLKSGMNRARSEMTKVSRDVKRLSLMVTGISTAAVKMASDLAKGVSEISTLADYTEGELSQIEKGLRKTRIETGQNLKALQNARYDIISAGFTKVAQSQQIMDMSAKAAVASVAEVNDTASAGLTVLQNYGMAAGEIERVYDVLQTVIRRGRTRMSEMTPYLAEVVQFGRTAKVEYEDLGALMSTMTIGMGGQTAKAMTALKGALRGLAAPAPEAEKWFKKLNIQVKYLKDGSMDVLGTIRQFQGMDLATIRKLIPDVEAAAGVLALANNLDKLESDLIAFQNTSGTMMNAWNKRADDFDTKWAQMIARFQDRLIDLGYELMPEIEKGIDTISTKMDEWLPTMKAFFQMIGNMVAWVVEHGDLIGKLFKIAVIAKVTTSLFSMGKALYYVASGLRVIAAASFLNPVTFGLAAIAAGFALIYTQIRKAKRARDEFEMQSRVMSKDDWIMANQQYLDLLHQGLDEKSYRKQLNLFYKAYTEGNINALKIYLKKRKKVVQEEQYDPQKELDNILGNFTGVGSVDDQSDLEKQLAAIEYETRLSEITAEGEMNRLNIRKAGIEKQLALLDENNEDQLEKWRDLQVQLAQVNRDITEEDRRQMEERIQIQKQYIDYAVGSIMDIGHAIGAGLMDIRNGWKDILKSILITTVNAIEQFAILAKIQNAIRMQFQGGVLSPKAWVDFLSNNAFILAQLAGLEAAKGAIMALAEGALIAQPTLALVGEAGPELVAPEKNFLDYVNSIQNQGGRQQTEEIKGLRNDVRELNKTMKKMDLQAEWNEKGFKVFFKNIQNKEKRNKL